MIFRGLIALLVGLICCWGLPGCGEDKPDVVQEEVVKPDAEEVEVEEAPVGEEAVEEEEGVGDETTSGNTPPTITSAKILPSPPQANTDLRVEVEAEDPDGDWINYAYQWVIVRAGDSIDDLEELQDETGETLSHELFTRGDAVAVRITPSDWYSEGEQVTTKLVIIGNSPPEIISSPLGASSNIYTYQVKAEDPDGDSCVYELGESSPPGMSIDPETGLLTWDTSKAARGDHTIMIHVHDGHGGNAYQRFTLTLSGETAPEKGAVIEEQGGTKEGEKPEVVGQTETAGETEYSDEAGEENEGRYQEDSERGETPEDSERYVESGETDAGDQLEESREFEEPKKPEETDQW